MAHIDKRLEIAIIGVGFSGMMTAVHLIRKATSPLTLYLINDKYAFGKGPAYSTTSSKHILNVPAAKMTAFPDQPTHFLDWASGQDDYKEIDKDILGRVFLPRKIYGSYLSAIWTETVSNKRPDTTINIVNAKAIDIDTDLNKHIIKLDTGASISVQYVILTTGNEPPRNLPVSDPALYEDPNYIGDPWNDRATQDLNKDKDILIIGNGLTMVDTVISIMDSGYKGVIHTVSPEGLAIMPHRYGYVPYTKLTEEVKAPYKLHELYTLANKHIKIMTRAGLSPEPVIDSLRPLTQKIWTGLSVEDKQRFLKYLMPHWNKIRHRMPGHIYDYLVSLRISGKLVVHQGKLLNMTKSDGGITAEIHETNAKAPIMLQVSRVINCIGPHTYVSQSLNPLLQKLVSKGTLQADPLRIGMNVTDRWTLIDAQNKEIPTLYTLGGNLRGLLWETTAIPELRVQAEKLATELIGKA
jgi:uncharacterized NAD(P)/FAD-binding protein YdhS